MVGAEALEEVLGEALEVAKVVETAEYALAKVTKEAVERHVPGAGLAGVMAALGTSEASEMSLRCHCYPIALCSYPALSSVDSSDLSLVSHARHFLPVREEYQSDAAQPTHSFAIDS